ncbi:MAG: CBS domain-containing protein [Ruminococcaceae bacterium]|nr:CBS domain-containing protein [Oscillospiraceae bacterium]
MKLKEIMSQEVVKIHPQENVAVAARLLANHNIGLLPVCNYDGSLCGVVTDRDLVTRCIAANRSPEQTKVQDIMTGRIVTAAPGMDVSVAAYLMGREQIRRLPVVEEGRLCGIVSVGDIAKREESSYDAAEAMEGICSNLSQK